MIRLLSLLCLLLLAGCHPPKDQAKAAPPVSKAEPLTCPEGAICAGTLDIRLGGGMPIYAPQSFEVCRKRGESHFASNSTFRILCWSESKQIFTEPYVLLEQ